jgi:cystinosin
MQHHDMQVWLNAQRASTEGWSISNVLLDFTGGVLSVAQLLLQCVILRDWTLIAGNPVKFGLGFVALAFDIVFMLQHYVWFRAPESDPAFVVVAADEEQSLVHVPGSANGLHEDSKPPAEHDEQ